MDEVCVLMLGQALGGLIFNGNKWNTALVQIRRTFSKEQAVVLAKFHSYSNRPGKRLSAQKVINGFSRQSESFFSHSPIQLLAGYGNPLLVVLAMRDCQSHAH